MIDDDDFLPISALQHLVFCPRQCALIHIECQWQENLLTARGRLEHQRVDDGFTEFRRAKRQLSALAVRSETLRLQGVLDLLELEPVDARRPDNLGALGLSGEWRLYPVEFKHGEPKDNDCDRVQLCAQALCLEEMYGVRIDTASLFYHRIRRREDVTLDGRLRGRTIQAAAELHRLFEQGTTPAPVYGKRCRSCSLIDVCLPKRLSTESRYRRLLFTPQEPAP